jgi:hypothetical protein
MNAKNIVFAVIYFALIGIIIWQYMAYDKLANRYQEEKILFDANYGEVIRLKDDLGAYADSCRLLRRDIQQLQDSIELR